MKELIERIEALDGPCFAVDTAIADAIGAPPGLAKPYTASIDAAMTLVPEGEVGIHGWDYSEWSIRQIHIDSSEQVYESRAKTPALALCAAALRSQSNIEGGE